MGWRHSEDQLSVTQVIVQEKGQDYIDSHHLYLIEGSQEECRLEAMTVRRTLKWRWPRMEAFLRAAGFVGFASKEFAAEDGKAYPVVIATRD